MSSFTFTPSKAGRYNVTSTFKGDNIYKSTSANSTLTAILSPIQLSIDSVTGEHGEKINLTAKLTNSDDNVSLSDRTVSFKVDGDFV